VSFSRELLRTAGEAVRPIAPVTAVVTLFQFTFVDMPLADFGHFLLGALLVTVGLLLFLHGVRVGLFPLGELIGAELPSRVPFWLLLVVAFLLGIFATLAEPDVRVLADQVDHVSNGEVSRVLLILAVSLGVGVSMVAAIARIVLQVPLSYLFAVGYGLVLLLTLITPENYRPLAFDAGGVTTGPMTVPFVLALGVGVASVLAPRAGRAEEFGLIGVASIGPILAVMFLGMMT
jgi:hypothetical protein